MKQVHRPDGIVTVPESLPLLPLRDIVVFPYMIIPLLVGRQPSIAALQLAMTGDKLVFVTAQLSAEVTEPEEADLHRVGVVARILQLLPLPDGTRKILIEGIVRAKLATLVTGEEMQSATIQVLDEVEDSGPEIEALQRNVANQFSEYVRLNRRIPDEVLMSVVSIDRPAQLADTIAAHVIGKVQVKQEVLASIDLAARFRALGQVLGAELEILQLEQKIEGEIKNQVQRNQKEMYLTERLKAIHKELGHEESGSAEIDELAESIEKARMSREASDASYKELDRLARMPSMSPEAAVIRNYVETLAALPWRKSTRDRLDLSAVQAQLDADHFGLERIKERILEYLAVLKLTRSLRSPILCLAGPPGVGKTSLGRSIAASLGRKFVRVSLGGMHDEAEIRGHRRTYIGAMPGRIIQSLKRCGSNNPVFLLDEIDKLGRDFRGDPASALLEALDPEQNAHFSDHYLEVTFDLSKVFFITTANVLHSIPAALRDRLEVIQLPGYLHHEKLAIAKGFLLPKQLKAHGIAADQVEISDAALEAIIHRYTRESGVRSLEREIGRLCRKVARQLAGAAAPRVPHRKAARGRRSKAVSERSHIDVADLTRYLSVAPYLEPEVPDAAEVGVATGLAWTSTGGEILPIEVTMMSGTGKLILTGQLGDVMKESARAALSYVRSIAAELGVRPMLFDKNDIHVHVPEGAIPKDGPSAGLAIATAMTSLVSGVPVHRQVAMTGEITLRGRALSIGGLNEKAVAALRAGVHTLLIPHENVKDIEELPAHVRESLQIVPVRDMREVLARALQGPYKRSRRGGGRPGPSSGAANYTH